MSAPETVLPTDTAQTDITVKTDLVGNRDFLLAVFGELVDAHPVVVSFEGNPASVPARIWFGRPWQGTADLSVSLPASANNYFSPYFSLAVFRPDEPGQFLRQMGRFQALYAVMLDDLGTKVALERRTLSLSWLLATSPDNHQAGHLLGEPLADGSVPDGLMNATVAAGLCDTGANGLLARLSIAANEPGGRVQSHG